MKNDIPSTSIERKVEEIFNKIEACINKEDFDCALEVIDGNRSYLQKNADMHHQVLLNKYYSKVLYRKIKDTYSKDKDINSFLLLFEKYRSYLEVHLGINEYKRLLDIYEKIQRSKRMDKLKIIIPTALLTLVVLIYSLGNFNDFNFPKFSLPSFSSEESNGNLTVSENAQDIHEEDSDSSDMDSTDDNTSEDNEDFLEDSPFEFEPNFILPSHSKELTLSDIDGMSAQDIRLAINEMYARHGYYFGSGANQRYFDAQEWYVPDESLRDASQVVSNFSDLENRNLAFLASQERRLRGQ